MIIILENKEEFLNCKLGLYKIFWNESAGGGFSFGCVGNNHYGVRWVAVSNWTAQGESNPTILMPNLCDRIYQMELLHKH